MRRAALALALIPGVVLSQINSEIAHVHGTGRLDVTVLGTVFSLSLAVPAEDILGFETPADSDEDRALVAKAISDLSKPLELFLLPEEAACETTAANVTLQAEGLGQAAEADQEHHAEFLADYQIECQNVEVVEAVRLAYFDRFPRAEKLVIRLDRSGEILTHDVTRAEPVLPF
ncbi:ZrgA family zinc uptake protein [Ruegeria sp. SCP11]|uniref:ZrgA family zinc uptake protein n=1 Tax=Ruegeria sp. SCP11 TaxID=3141378 RepID=UPI00333B9172